MNALIQFLQTEVPEMRAHLLGQFILRHLTKTGVSPGAAAEALGVSRSTFYDYLSGRINTPPAHRLAKLAEVLSLPEGTFDLFNSEALGAEALGALTPRARREEPAEVLREDSDGQVLLPVDPVTGEDPDDEDEPETPEDRPDIIAGEVEGYLAVWDELERTGMLFRAGAFTETIARSQARWLYWEHAHTLPDKGGSTPIGATFMLQEDPVGLFMRAWVANTQLGRELVTLMRVAELAGLEMGASAAGFPVIWRPNFVEPPRAWERGVDEGPGALLSFDLKEASLAGFPALNSARVRLASDDPVAMLAAGTERLARITGG